MNEWGVPDWQDADAYGDTSEWSVFRWRWEFYRRRADLREEYASGKLEQHRKSCELSVVLHGSSDGVFDVNDKRLKVYAVDCSEKYGYVGLPNPSYGDHGFHHIFPHGDREDDMGVVLPGFSGKTSQSVRVGEKTYGFVFNLEKPLGPQFEKAREETEAMQLEMTGSKKPRKRRSLAKYPIYLRVLDGRESGASWSEIAKILTFTAQTEQSARDTWKQANALCFNSWS